MARGYGSDIVNKGELKILTGGKGDQGTTGDWGLLLWQGIDDVEISNEICRLFFCYLWNRFIMYLDAIFGH